MWSWTVNIKWVYECFEHSSKGETVEGMKADKSTAREFSVSKLDV